MESSSGLFGVLSEIGMILGSSLRSTPNVISSIDPKCIDPKLSPSEILGMVESHTKDCTITPENEHENTFFKFNPRDFNGFMKRDSFIGCFGWSVPSRQALNEIRDFLYEENSINSRPSVLEIAAERGLWSALLSEFADVKSTSLFEHKMSNWFDVEELDMNEALKKYNQVDCVFASWLRFMPDMDLVKSKKLIIIGEDSEGCTAFLSSGEHGYKLVKTIMIPQWQGLHDVVRCYERIQ